MALGTLELDPEEYLGHIFRHHQRIAFDEVEIGRGVGEVPALRAEQFSHQLVHRRVGRNCRPEPVVVPVHALPVQNIRNLGHTQDFGPLHGPQFRKFRPLQKRIDEFRPLFGVRVRQEGGGLFRRGNGAEDVDIGAPHEHLVAAEICCRDPELSQLVEYVGVYVIPFYGIGRPVHRGALVDHDGPWRPRQKVPKRAIT